MIIDNCAKINSKPLAMLCMLSVHGSSMKYPKAVLGNEQSPPTNAKAPQLAFTNVTRSTGIVVH